VAALGRDPGPLTAAESLSHHVFVGADVVVKVIEAGRHPRLDREITLARSLPPGITAPLIAGGALDTVRYACYARVPGAVPEMGSLSPSVARALASQAVERLDRLHRWTPSGPAAVVLGDGIDDGRVLDVDDMPDHLLGGLAEIAARAPRRVHADVPVHADCHWANWLADGSEVTALLDFEWARFGDPLDDWFFLLAFSGPHLAVVLDVVSRATGISPDELRAACEVRSAGYLASDLRLAARERNAAMAADRLKRLEEVVIGRRWRTPGT
jgi:hypothetical protein